MNYYVARNGQTYGPYGEETVRKYLSEGSVLAGDMARTEEMATWIPLGQLLGGTPAPAGATVPPPPLPQPGAFTGTNVPPSLHWVVVLLLTLFTGIFQLIWALVQANWVKTIDPASRAFRDLILAIVIPFAGFIPFALLAGTAGIFAGRDYPNGGMSIASSGLFFLAVLILCGFVFGGFIFHMKAYFGMRDSLQRYYNTVEPIHLRLSGIMTFFFNVIYFQYHFTRIAEWKRTGVLRP